MIDQIIKLLYVGTFSWLKQQYQIRFIISVTYRTND